VVSRSLLRRWCSRQPAGTAATAAARMQIASRRFAGGKNKREIKRMCSGGGRETHQNEAARWRSRGMQEGRIYHGGTVRREDGRRGRTSALAEGGRGEPVGPRQDCESRGVGGCAGIIHHPRRREACANTPPYHTTRPLVVEDCGVGGGGRPPTRNDRVRWRSWSRVHRHQRDWSYRGSLRTVGAVARWSACYATRVRSLINYL